VISVDDWQTWAAGHLASELRWLSPEEAWDRVVLSGGNVARAVRKGLLGEQLVRDAERAIASQTLWLLATCERLGFSLMEATWSKYPGACPYCVRDSPIPWEQLQAIEPSGVDGEIVFASCSCAGHPKPDYSEVKELVWPFRIRLDLRPSTVRGFENMFERIYGTVHEHVPLADIAFHVQEEAAEVLAELKNRDLECTRDEVADAFSWLASLAGHPQITSAGGRRLRVEDALARHFGGPGRTYGR
jgi:NTP pyrophosphatase (non-canonical NTP hydrolase)